MSPRGAVLGLSIATAITASALAVLAPVAIALGLTGFGVLFALLLNFGYARSLGLTPRPLSRVPLDRLVALEIVIAFAAPLAVAELLTAEVLGRIWIDPVWAVLVGAFAGVTTICFVSSLVDWYYVLPRRDGLMGAPPCRSAADQRWQRVTWFWFLHRFVAAVATVGGAYAIAFCLGLWLAQRYPDVLSVAGGMAPLLAVVTYFARNYLRDIREVWHRLFSPTVSLGCHVRARSDDGNVSGFLLNVALERVDLLNRRGALGHAPIAAVANGDHDTARNLCDSANCVRGTPKTSGRPPSGGNGGCLADVPGEDREPPRTRRRLLVV